ncbi:LysE family translocator [Nonomuraea sp. NBC_01738]|uniref:LysE family translocator n=1 Tax=Nonomuraea sp. NBC_01738 TaxID=2976003 RepID=UPI002E131F68|nr:LysE family translocator [Nonomuraea sp. NBC_01738]
MDISGSVWSFALLVGLLTLTPGLDTALILRTSLLSGRKAAWGVVLGVQLGTLTWGVAAAAGISALLTASQLAYDVLRWAGAAYLIWMGARMLWAARRAPARETEAETPRWTFTTGLRSGLITNLLNPKVGAFYLAVLPQFIPEGAPPAAMGLLLAGVHVTEGLLWSTALITLATLMSAFLRTPRVRRVLDRVTGLVIVAFGLRLAAES